MTERSKEFSAVVDDPILQWPYSNLTQQFVIVVSLIGAVRYSASMSAFSASSVTALDRLGTDLSSLGHPPSPLRPHGVAI